MTLSICGTPIGNLGDASPRLRATLAAADIIACEDTRRTRQLLSAFDIHGPKLEAVRSDNEAVRADGLIDQVAAGHNVVFVSDAGMPATSDPGGVLVARARERGVAVEVIPGPCAVSAALARCGVSGTRYTFVGFLPRKSSELRQLFQEHSGEMIVGFESPGRVRATMDALAQAQPDRIAHVARELTKIHEEVVSGTASEVLEQLDERVRGEIVVVLEAQPEDDNSSSRSRARALALARRLQEEGMAASRAAAVAAGHEGVPRSALYDQLR